MLLFGAPACTGATRVKNFPQAALDDQVDSLAGAHQNIANRGGHFEFERVDISRPGSALGFFDRRLAKTKAMLW
jgi:hypothetical protein